MSAGMGDGRIDIALRRGRLLERIAAQRAALAGQLQPVSAALHATDRAVAGVQGATAYLKAHPRGVAAALALLVVLKPRRVWRWAKRGFVVWRAWRALRQRATAFGLRFS